MPAPRAPTSSSRSRSRHFTCCGSSTGSGRSEPPDHDLGPRRAVLGDRLAEIDRSVGHLVERSHEQALEDAELARRGAADLVGAREAVPGAREGEEARATTVAVGGEHRADAPAPVGVGADDDRVAPHAVEHGPPCPLGKAVDCSLQPGDRVARTCLARSARHRFGRPHAPQPRRSRHRSERMKLGLHIGYWGLGLSSEEQLALVREAESLGYDSAWSAEAYGSDAATILGWLAQGTERIKLGSAIFQMPGRSAAMTAMTAATLDQLSGGRMLLGIGSSGPQVAEGWHGQRFAKQLQRTREYIAVVRMALARERVEFHGETLELPLPDGPGKALKLTIAPVQERIPVYLAAIGPKNTTLAAEIADGWIPIFFSPENVGDLRPLLEEGAARADRSLDGFDIAPTVNVSIDDDLAAARDRMRPFIALYVGGMGSRKQNFYNALAVRYGFEEAARKVQDLYLDGKRDEAAAAVPDELVDTVTLCGPADRVRERLAVYRDAGVGTLGITPTAGSKEERIEQLRLVAELCG